MSSSRNSEEEAGTVAQDLFINRWLHLVCSKVPVELRMGKIYGKVCLIEGWYPGT